MQQELSGGPHTSMAERKALLVEQGFTGTKPTSTLFLTGDYDLLLGGLR